MDIIDARRAPGDIPGIGPGPGQGPELWDEIDSRPPLSDSSSSDEEPRCARFSLLSRSMKIYIIF